MNIKKAVSAAVAAIMTVSLCVCAIPVWAEEESTATNSSATESIEWKEVSTESELNGAINSGTTYIKLKNDISLSTDSINVSSGKTVVLDLGNHTLSDYFDWGEYDGFPCIKNYGTLTVQNGALLAECAGIWNYGSCTIIDLTINASEACYNPIETYDDSVTVIKSGDFKGYYYAVYAESGTLTIDGGTFSVDEENGDGETSLWICSGITGYINGGTFGGTDVRSICSVGNLTITDGTFLGEVFETSDEEFNLGTTTVSGGTFHGGVLLDGDVSTITGGTFYDHVQSTSGTNGVINISGGVFKEITVMTSTTVTEDAKASFELSDATIKDAVINGGNYSGTISSVSGVTVNGGSFSETLADALKDYVATGKAFIMGEDGVYTIGETAIVTLTIKATPASEAVKISVDSVGGSSVAATDGTATKEFSQGASVNVVITQKLNSQYLFNGLRDSAGNNVGTYTISTETTLEGSRNIYTFEPITVNEDMSLTAEFYTAISITESNAKAWYEKYESAEYFEVANESDMLCLAYCNNELGYSFSGKTAALTNDLDFSVGGYVWIGNASKPFTGTFDGKNHTISNVTVDNVDSSDASGGLFGVVSNGTIKNLTVKNIKISTYENAGGIAGCTYGNTTIDNCHVIGGDIHTSQVARSAGIVGYASGTISNCSASELTNTSSAMTGWTYGVTIKNMVVKDSTLNIIGIIFTTGSARIENVSSDNEFQYLVGNLAANAVLTVAGSTTDISNANLVNPQNNNGTTVIEEGTYTSDITQNVASDSASMVLEGGRYKVISSDSPVTATAGVYTSGSRNGVYDQMYIFNTVLNTDGKVTYNISSLSSADESTEEQKIQKEYTYIKSSGDGAAMIGLIITDIPIGTKVTVDIQ